MLSQKVSKIKLGIMKKAHTGIQTMIKHENLKKIPEKTVVGCTHKVTTIYIIPRFIQASLYEIQGLFKVFLKNFLLFSRSENLYKILIYTFKYYFGNVGLLYLNY